MLDAETLVHHVNIEIAPAAGRNAFGAAVNIGPIGFLQFSTHHPGDLRGQQTMDCIALAGREGGEGFRRGHG